VRVLLISANTETMNMPVLPLGLACVAAATRNAGNEVALLNLMFEGDPMLGIRNSSRTSAPTSSAFRHGTSMTKTCRALSSCLLRSRKS